jgi:sporulation protein YhbH
MKDEKNPSDSSFILPPSSLRGEAAVSQRIEKDHQRFRKIVRGKVKSSLNKYITRGELIGKKGRELVSIPLPQIELPQFRYGQKGSGGVGQGEGDPGDPLTAPQGDGKSGAGDQPGGHILEVELTMEELAAILGEELALPRIEPRGKKNIVTNRDKYTSIRQTGPESLRHFKRTFKRAMKRQIASNTYDPDNPVVVPIRADKQYRSWKDVPKPESVACIIYMMDVSGSMTDEQKEIVRIEAFWIDTWLKAHYKGIENVYIIHDAAAHLVDEHTFYHTRESGGTKISSAYELALKVINAKYPPDQWNIYAFHFSDGDNWGDDIPRCIELLTEQLLPKLNLFGYGQVESPYGSGEFFEYIHELLSERDNVVASRIPDREAIVGSIKEFLGTGR